MLNKTNQILKSVLVEVTFKSNWNSLVAAHPTIRQRFLQFHCHYLIMLILNEIAAHSILLSSQIFQHLNDLNPTDNRVSTGNGWHYVACHILHLVERLLLNTEAEHT